MTTPRQGEIFSVELPGRTTDKHGRPALVVSPDYRNEFANDILVVPLSTSLRPMPTHVFLPAGAGGLKRPSMAKAEQITALPKPFLGRGPWGSRITTAQLDEVRRAVWRALGGDER